MQTIFRKDIQYYKFCLYGFFKNLRFFEAFLVLFFLEKGLSFFEIGLLYSLREITIYIFEIPTGIIADSFGRRKTMLLAFVFYILSFFVFFLSGFFEAFVVAIVFYSLGDAFRTGNHKAMVIEYLSFKGWLQDKVHYYGNTRSWSQMGSALSAITGGFIVFYTGSFRYIFLFSIIPYILDLILVITYPRILDGDIQKFNKRLVKKEFQKLFRHYRNSLVKATVLKAVFNLSVFSGYYKAVKDYLQPLVKTYAISVPLLLTLTIEQRSSLLVGFVFFIIFLLSSFASRISGRVSTWFDNLAIPLNLTLIIGFFAGILSGIFFNMGFFLVSIVLFVVIYMIENLRKPIGVAFISEAVDKRIMASAISTDSLLQSILAAIIAPVIGLLADHLGVGYGIVIITVILAISLPLYFAIHTRK
ncbi:MAG: MFS transporter [Bacteroidetes bacterium]|nr:MFS transporter [Bacteroidota bacterium]